MVVNPAEIRHFGLWDSGIPVKLALTFVQIHSPTCESLVLLPLFKTRQGRPARSNLAGNLRKTILEQAKSMCDTRRKNDTTVS